MGNMDSGRKRLYLGTRLAKLKVSNLTRPALRAIEDAINSEDEAISFAASKWVLEMALGKPKVRAEVASDERLSIVLVHADADGIRQRMEPGEHGAKAIESSARVLD